MSPRTTDARTRLLDAALKVVREKGYTATRVEDLCAAAGVTKGSFFHHFPTKEALAIAAAEHWSAVTGAFFAAAPYHAHPDPLDRVLGYLDFRRSILQGSLAEFTCYAGTTIQETFDTWPAVCRAAARSVTDHAAVLARDIEAARQLHAPDATWSAESLALHTQAVLQGPFVLAKAAGGPEPAIQSVDHLRRYIEMLFPNRTQETR